MHDDQTLIGTGRAAKLLGIDRATLTRQVAAGLVPLRARLESGALVFELHRIEQLADEREQRGAA